MVQPPGYTGFFTIFPFRATRRLEGIPISNRKQRVVLNDQCFSWVDIGVGVPQGATLGSLFFYICQ